MNEERMSKKPVIVKNGDVVKLERILLSSKTFQENWLQELLEKEPNILPTASIDSIYAPLFCIGREIPMPSGFIDNLCISPKGYIVIVETKLWRNPEARREVVGQIIDYAKDLKFWNYEQLDGVYRNYHKKSSSLFEALVGEKYQMPENEATFIDITEKNIKNARFLLMIVGDGIREGVERMADFLNETPNMQYRLALCELEVYDLGNDTRLVIPQLTTKTKIVDRGIIRIEEKTGSIVDIVMNQEEDIITKEPRVKVDGLNYDEFYNRLKDKNTSVVKESLSDLLNDLDDLGFSYHIGSSECVISYILPSLQVKIPILRTTVNDKTWIVPSDILDKLEKTGYSKTIGDKLLEQLKPYLNEDQKNKPYEKLNAFYYFNLSTLIDNKDKILEILEGFKSNF